MTKSTTPITDSLMRRADSMIAGAVVVPVQNCRDMELELIASRAAIELILNALRGRINHSLRSEIYGILGR